MRILTTGAAAAALVLSACQPADGAKTGEPTPPNPPQTVAPPAEKPVHRFKIGALEAIALFDGTNEVPNDNQVFGVGLTPQAVGQVLQSSGQPTDAISLEIHPLLVRSGGRTLLFDTGLGGGKGQLMQSLQAAGVDPAAVTDVLISHAHGDHIGGLVAGGGLAFPNAVIRLSQAEWAAMKADPEQAELVRLVTPKVQAFDPGGEVAPGVTSRDASGHTPGHVTYLIADGQNQLLYIGDVLHHWVVSVERPEWINGFDADPSAGLARREDVVGALKTTGAHIYAYHFPFPGLGRVQMRQGGTVFVAEATARDGRQG